MLPNSPADVRPPAGRAEEEVPNSSPDEATPWALLPSGGGLLSLLLAMALSAAVSTGVMAQQCTSDNTVTADVVAFDQPILYNRLGAFDPAGMIYALRRDVVSKDGSGVLEPGNVELREGKRPRPLVLRVNEGDCLEIAFENLLAPEKVDEEQPATRAASVHVVGMQVVNSIADVGANVGDNGASGNGLVDPGESATYTYYAQKEGGHLFYSAGATTGGDGDGGSIARGLFGSVNVEPPNSEWYRAKVLREDLELAKVGETPDGQPIMDYEATYPSGHELAGLPILEVTQDGEIVHGELDAIITGPDRGNFAGAESASACAEAAEPGALEEGSTGFPKDTIMRNRCEPFREFTSIFHDEIGILQAFDEFRDPVLSHTLHSGRDAFAINYGTGGIGARILANRLGVGPQWDCTECKYEEYFLSSWPAGDPATPVDVPANADLDGDGEPDEGPKATQALYPRDPSNVHHSYLNDHVKIRNLHAGPKEHHIFHLHAHQWVTNPDDDESTYLDSQAIGPGSTYSYEIAYDGGGNRPKTPGDAIFHCHFYPHFAQGMWALWRVHDVFEQGTQLDEDGRPAPGARALPDGEIPAGMPIPAVVPLPTKAMAPMPTEEFPGYPFYIPGIGGKRAPHPPLDTEFDGGLPRHVVQDGEADFPPVNRLDFEKVNVEMDAIQLPEQGTELERNAMDFHAAREPDTGDPTGLQAAHPTFAQPTDATGAVEDSFRVNGLDPQPGAPYADPCVDDFGDPLGEPIVYKSASIQVDAVHNKKGWHFPQTRMFSLWDDVDDVRDRSRPPEPLFFRANTNHCIEYQLVDLIPNTYEVDDFQVVTPTDVIGQHIHLVKFDVTSSDGAANGFNYEDGSFAFDEVTERIDAIRNTNECVENDSRDGTFECPVAEQHPFFDGPRGLGAQTTVQRWLADNVLNNDGQDRTLRTVFTHDHFAPSTHQQAGLYAGLVVEPEGSEWFHNESGVQLGTRFDGGPTSWQAIIEVPESSESQPSADSAYREFNLQIADFGLAYRAGGGLDQGDHPVPDPAAAINPPGRVEVGLPNLLASPFQVGECPTEDESTGPEPPCPELISADDPGTMLVNYRNEPVALRIRDPETNAQADAEKGSLAYAFSSEVSRRDDEMDDQPEEDDEVEIIDREDEEVEVQPGFYPPLTNDMDDRDPYTPMARAYEGDNTQFRILIGAHEEGHNFSVHGTRWLFEPSWENSGFRNNQMMGISEHFEFDLPRLVALQNKFPVDFMYRGGASLQDLWSGLWGLMRVYDEQRDDLATLSTNPDGELPKLANGDDFNGVCPADAPVRDFDITAVLAQDALPEGTLVYNERTNQGGRLHDPTAAMYVRTSDLQDGTVDAEPLILRANAGDCIEVTLRNDLPEDMPDKDGFSTLPMIIQDFNKNDIRPASHAGIHPQLVAYDVQKSDGVNVGQNQEQTAEPDKEIQYRWYAGTVDVDVQDTDGDGTDEAYLEATPVEFGATNLSPADPIEQTGKGLIGALVVEPQGATWVTDQGTRAQATVTKPDGETYREFVLVAQNDVNLRRGPGDGEVVPQLAESEDPEDSGNVGINYRTEPMWKRFGYEPDTPLGQTRDRGDLDRSTSNELVGGDPVTPVYTAAVGEDVRFRMLQPGGHQRNSAIEVYGHATQHVPYQAASTEIGDNLLSEWKGVREGLGPMAHFDYVLAEGQGGPAGGEFGVTGDYLVRDLQSFHFDGGMWAIFRVLDQ